MFTKDNWCFGGWIVGFNTLFLLTSIIGTINKYKLNEYEINISKSSGLGRRDQ